MTKKLLFRSQIVVDVCDQHIVDKHTWHFHGRGYVSTYIDGKQVHLHRLIFPEYPLMDHKNTNKLDNRRLNLRECTLESNNQNRNLSKANTSGFKGVYYKKKVKSWWAYISAYGVRMSLGQYKTAKEAALAYNNAAIKYHGKFANLNKLEVL